MPDPEWKVLVGDCREVLRSLPAQSVHTVVTSPPYFGLRDYGTGDEQIGLEPSPDDFADALVAVFREVWRVLRDDGTVWLNLGDTYANRAQPRTNPASYRGDRAECTPPRPNVLGDGIKAKDLIGIPWMVAFALRADGWYLRSEVVWSKPNAMPESVTDRLTCSHEQVFLLAKSGDPQYWTHRAGAATRSRPAPDWRWVHRETGEESETLMLGDEWQRVNLWRSHDYFYDADAIREQATPEGIARESRARLTPYDAPGQTSNRRTTSNGEWLTAGRNKRSVWTIATQPYPGAHFATFPPKLIEPCILAGCPERCCPVCGAPWVRITERRGVRERGATTMLAGGKAEALMLTGARRDGLSTSNSHNGACAPEILTLGWVPTCDHGAGPIPGTVLDPFAGAYTAVLQAVRSRRSAIGIELSPEHAELGRERVELDVRLGHRPAQRGPVMPADQATLFDG